jgi:hypothetical protein
MFKHIVPPPLLLDDVHAPALHPPVHELRNCHCPVLMQMSTSEPLQMRAPATHTGPPEEPPAPDDDVPPEPLPEDVDPDAPTVASLPEELPWLPPHSHGPRPLPSCTQTWNPAHPPGPAHATEAPGTQAWEPDEPSGEPSVTTEPPPHCAVSTASDANTTAAWTAKRRDPTIRSSTLAAATATLAGPLHNRRNHCR